MRIAYHVEDPGPFHSARTAQLLAVLDQRIGVEARVASGVSELVEAERVLAHTWQIFGKEWEELVALVREHAEELDSEYVAEHFDQEWKCDHPLAIRSLFIVELMVASLLNHLYIVTEQILLLTRSLLMNHDLCVHETLRRVKLTGKGWKRRVQVALTKAYVPLEPHCSTNLDCIQRLIRIRGERVHTKHLFAHVVSDGKFHLAFQHMEHLGAEPYETVLVSRELADGLSELQCFLQWYVEALRPDKTGGTV